MADQNHSDRQHSRLSASGAHRWMACPGSISLCDTVPETPSSEYADEGTAAHQLAERCLTAGTDPQDYKDSVIHVSGREFEVDDDMIDAVQIYLYEVRNTIDSIPEEHRVIGIEQMFTLQWFYPGMGGTNDFCVADTGKGELYIFDYKHGKGVAVEVEENPQLRIYALGALGPDDHGIDMVYTTIVQPRAYHPDGPVRTEEISVAALRAWAEEDLLPAAKATGEEGTLQAGDHCKFCPALAVCPAQMENAFAVAQTAFSPLPVLPDVTRMPIADLAMVMRVSERFSAWAKAAEAHAQHLAEQGQTIPGYKLVAKRSLRKWADNAETFLHAQLGDAAYSRRLISPAQAEKLVKDNGYNLDLSGLVIKPDNGVVLVPATDKRKEVGATAVPALAFMDDLDLLK